MKKKILILLLVFTFVMPIFSVNVLAEDDDSAFMNITLQPGADGTQLNFNFSTIGLYDTAFVQMTEKTNIKDDKFPTKNGTFKMSVAEATLTDVGSQKYPVYSYKATITGLEPLTDYVYRIGDGVEYSNLYNYRTPATKNFTALVFNDVQSNISGRPIVEDTKEFSKSIALAKKVAPEANLMLHLGDQATDGAWAQFAGLMDADGLKEMTFAPIVGNHDTNTAYYNLFYNQPNNTDNAVTYGAGDYYFKYGKALFIGLNCMSVSYTEHENTFEQAISAYPECSWIIAMMHFGLYDTAPYSSLSKAKTEYFEQLLQKYNVDLFISGHIHRFSRSKFIKDGEPVENNKQDEQGRFVDPEGIVHYSGPSGIWNYPATTSTSDYAEFIDKYIVSYAEYTPNLNTGSYTDKNYEAGFSTITVKGNYLAFETYMISNIDKTVNGQNVKAGETYLFDNFTIVKSSIDENDGNDEVKKENPTSSSSGCQSALSMPIGLLWFALIVIANVSLKNKNKVINL